MRSSWYYSDRPVSPQTLSRPMLRSTECLRADWEVTIMPGGPKWCELFLILYCTPYSTNNTDVITVCLFRIFTFEQIILNPVTIAKQLVIIYMCGDFRQKKPCPSQPTTGAGTKLSAHVLR